MEREIDMSLKQKKIIITGASTGLGKQIAFSAARQGAALILLARNREKLSAVASECLQMGAPTARYYEVDLQSAEQIDGFLDELQVEKIVADILVNNAGHGYNQDFLSLDFTLARAMFEVNVLALMYLSQKIVMQMLSKGSGHIINIASLAGKVASPQSAVYAASKAAVISFSNSLRLELKPMNIQVSTVNLGPMDTSFFDDFDPDKKYLQRVEMIALQPDRVADKVIQLMNNPKRELNLPVSLHIATRLSQICPALSEWVIERLNIK